MNGAKLLLECLKRENVDTIFGYPGGAVIPLYDALYDYQHVFKHIRTAHEQGSVHAADGYARSTNKVGVCFVTSGPGATNAITGIATAYMDSTPLVVISGQVPTSLLGKDSFQEIDITGVTLSITKHNYLVRDVNELQNVIKEAFEVANSGRKGPVLIDIPKDLFTKEVEFNEGVNKKPSITQNKIQLNESKINEVVNLIENCSRPIIYAGGGIKSSESEELLCNLATKIDTPVVNTLMGLSTIDRDHELSLGMVGMHGSRESNLAVANADLVLAVGARFSDRVIGKSSEFAKNAKIIHVDIDSSEINKNVDSSISIVGELKEVIESIFNKVNIKDNTTWKEEIKSYKSDKSLDYREFHPDNIFSLISKEVGYESCVVTDVGQHQMWAGKYFTFKGKRNFITSAGLGTMGFGMGAAIGAKLGEVNKRVILVTGDGSFRMNCNELSTISRYNIPIVIVMLNNRSLGMVRQWQKLFSEERYSETDVDDYVDYVKLVNAYNIDGYVANNLNELEDILKEVNYSKPVFIQCEINKDYDVFPIVPPNDSIANFIEG